MLTPRQIRAGRALLGWDAAELAERTGIHRQTIGNIENSHTQAQAANLERIAQCLRDAGVEFTAGQGVRLRENRLNNVEIYEGPERFQEFTDFVYNQVATHGGDICLSVSDERLFSRYRKNTSDHYERMQKLYNNGTFKSFRILANQSDFSKKYTYNTYKWIPQEPVAPTAFYTFADHLSLISFTHVISPYVLVIESSPLVSSYKQAFDIAWAIASDPPKKKITKS